ncbi:hypothetical protein BX616_010831, partial [Lobosporangium transversale]
MAIHSKYGNKLADRKPALLHSSKKYSSYQTVFGLPGQHSNQMMATPKPRCKCTQSEEEEHYEYPKEEADQALFSPFLMRDIHTGKCRKWTPRSRASAQMSFHNTKKPKDIFRNSLLATKAEKRELLQHADEIGYTKPAIVNFIRLNKLCGDGYKLTPILTMQQGFINYLERE